MSSHLFLGLIIQKCYLSLQLNPNTTANFFGEIELQVFWFDILKFNIFNLKHSGHMGDYFTTFQPRKLEDIAMYNTF